MRIELIQDASELGRLEQEWNELVSSSSVNNPFLQWEWCSTWWRHYGDQQELALVLLRDAARLVGLAPLYVEKGSRGRRILKFIGMGEVCSEYLAPVLRQGCEESGLREIMKFLLSESAPPWHQTQLVHVPDHGPSHAIETILQASGRSYRVDRDVVCWQIALAASWDEFISGLSRNRKEKLKRARRDMEKYRFEFQCVREESELNDAWKNLKRLHQVRWEAQGMRGCFSSERFRAFHEDLLQPLWRRGMVSLTSLVHEGRTIAASYCLRHGGHVYFYQSGVDPQWKHGRPGHSLRYCELQLAIAQGDRVYDMMSGDEEYKSQWATHQTAQASFTVAGRGLIPRAQLGFESAMHWIKRSARAHLPNDTWATLRRWKSRITRKVQST